MAEGKGKPKQPKAGPAKPERAPLSRRKAMAFLAVTLSLPFVLFAILEVGLRLANYGGDMPAFEAAVSAPTLRIPSSRLGRRYFPKEQYPPAPPGDVFLASKPAHSMRIFVLGESSTAGFPYSANGTFSRVLRDALTDVLPNDTVEIINLGMAATNSYTIADLAGEVVAERPDAVLIYGGHNEYYGALGAGSTETLGSFPGLVRLYLRLQHLKTFLLLRNTTNAVIGTFRGGRTAEEIAGDATRMESVVGDQRITYGGDAYKRGVAQYESNLSYAVKVFRAAGIPVFVGSTPGNLRNLKPFGTSGVPPDSSATHVFDSATALLASGDSLRAAEKFSRARDLDVIRFRAPSEFAAIVRGVARQNGATYVPVLEEISRESQYGIPGEDLFLEHVHLNQKGYALIARSFYAALARQDFLGRKADASRFAGWDEYERRMRLTSLDHRIAYHTVKTVITRWPFMPVATQLDYRGTYQPVDFLDSVAFTTSRGGMPWAQAKGMIADRYASRGDHELAVTEYEGLIRDGPQIEVAYRLAGRVLLGAGQPERARPYLEKAYSLAPSAFTAYSLGVFAMQDKDPQRGIALFSQALQLDPGMPQALFQLSLAYGVIRNIEGARAAASRLAQIQPGYPGLADWLSALGMAGR